MRHHHALLLLLLLLLLLSLSIATQANDNIKQLEKNFEKADGREKVLIACQLSEYYVEKEPGKTINYAEEALRFRYRRDRQVKDEAQLYHLLGEAYYHQKDFRKSAENYEKEYDIIKSWDNDTAIMINAFNLGVLNQYKLNRSSKAIEFYESAIDHARRVADEALMMNSYKLLAGLYSQNGEYKLALQRMNAYVALAIAESKQQITILSNRYEVTKAQKHRTEKRLRMTADELLETEIEVGILDSALDKETEVNKNKTDTINRLNIKTYLQEQELRLKEADLKLREEENRRQRLYIWAAVVILLIGGLFSFFLMRQYRLRLQAYSRLEKAHQDLAIAHKDLAQKNSLIVSSINYATRIQEAILVDERIIHKYIPELFIFFRPRDMVSGDFYWFTHIEGKSVIAAIDCTGHGVPGAFMSMIGNTLLNHIVNEQGILEPEEILIHLHEGVVESLQKAGKRATADDGMDMSLCVIDHQNKQLIFGGAKNPLYMIREGEIEMIRGSYCSIGQKKVGRLQKIVFTQHKVDIRPGTWFYIFSDGYADQFGGERDKKLGRTRMKQILLEASALSSDIEAQKKFVEQAYSDWQGDHYQVDDTLLIGFRL